jgi:hypothetical protein
LFVKGVGALPIHGDDRRNHLGNPGHGLMLDA